MRAILLETAGAASDLQHRPRNQSTDNAVKQVTVHLAQYGFCVPCGAGERMLVDVRHRIFNRRRARQTILPSMSTWACPTATT